jgi:hypothetical protein
MGEPEPQVVEQLDMGTEPINQGAVVIPTEEHIIGFAIELTRSDRKWSSFTLTTDQRQINVSPGLLGQDVFDAFCDDVRAMFQSVAGGTVLSKLRALLRQRPLQVETVVAEQN